MAPNPLPLMSSPVPSIVNVPTVSDDPGHEHINPAVSDDPSPEILPCPIMLGPIMSDLGTKHINSANLSKIGSIKYNQQENGYNLKWELRANFNT